MATSGFRVTLGMTFSTEEEKDAFKRRLEDARSALFPEENVSKRPDNTALLNAMLDLVMANPSSVTTNTLQTPQSFLEAAGM